MADGAQSARDRLLSAGREILAKGEADLLAGGLTIDQVSRRAGVSTQTFHNTFPRRNGVGSKARYLDELTRTLLADAASVAAAPDPSDQEAPPPDGDPRKLIREASRREYLRLSGDQALQLRLVASALLASDRTVAAAVRRQYADHGTAVRASYDETFQQWGAVLRRPFTVESLAVVVTALAEGLVLRSRFDPDAVPEELFGEAVLALMASVVDIEDRHAHIDDVIAPVAGEVMRDFQLSQPRPLPEDPEQAIIDAASAEFAGRGYANTRITDIALSAGVDLPTVKRLFTSKAHIVVAGLKPAFDTLHRRVTTDRKLHSPVVVIERFTERFADMIITHRPLADAMALVASTDTAQSPSNLILIKDELNYPGLIVGAIEDGQASGELITTGPSSFDLAAMVVNNIIFRCLSRRTESAREVADAVVGVVVRGMSVRG
ncbi:TetR/AcrR family transcriptional regulator [Millisia brevis]|uniref:TetR/AcrR family transcriptional regulator n=1 Tax=Millisia brevis TaxID=264148 RepID=UPI0008307D5D|nr:TetR/AcrR family transcriptional regulator [Millisia brevis]